jgi:hypothetical protein
MDHQELEEMSVTPAGRRMVSGWYSIVRLTTDGLPTVYGTVVILDFGW